VAQRIRDFIIEHAQHTRLFLSGIAASSSTWRVRCGECFDDYIINIPEELSNNEAIDLTIELDEFVNKLCDKLGLEARCLGWV